MLYRNFKISVAVFCLTTVLVFSPLAFAQTATDYFNQGVKAATAGDYPAALVEFKKAKKAGLKSPALTYNFAVTYYKLGQFEEAKKAFTSLTTTKQYKQLAYYNLGLVANKQKDIDAAIKWFQRAYRSGESDKVKILALEALKRLGASPKRSLRSTKQWTGFLSASLASDSNVTLANDDLAGVASESDTSASLSAYGAHWLKGGSNSGVRLFLTGHMQRYSTQSLYDYNQFSLGAARYDRLGDWRMRFGGTWDEIYFGGEQYERILSAEVRGQKPLSKDDQLRLRYTLSRINATNPVYDYLEGWRQQFRVGTQMRNKDGRFLVYYQLELNDREDYASTISSLFYSYSPTRHTLRVTGWWDLNSFWALRLDGRYRYSKYNDDHVFAGNITERREDTQARLSARLSRKLTKDWEFRTAFTVTNNNSTIDNESYDRSLFTAGLTWNY